MRLPLAFTALALSALPAFAGPASDAVAFFYASPGAEFDVANRDRFTDPAKAVLDANDKAELCLDFSFVIDGQDADDAEVKRTLKLSEEVKGQDATVTASFTLFPDQKESERRIIWTLKQEGGAWKVADVRSEGTDWRLGEFDCANQ